jgi:(E)-4-hydroxy-3-methylbut-2-enyl-diphosphate synthase
VADIHFSPAAALTAAELADKVRINPGNYTDSRKFAVREYSDEEYGAELARVEGRFTPLVLKCKERGIAMRIGTNHGSLSDRIMNRFGDTPEGMVESALEFAHICRKHEYHDLIFSMKASNPKVMIAAYRLLAARMDELGWDYPFHLGVTEAGNAEDGRIKSAIGIGSLLEDGIGDTIRVSLTEEPEEEIPVAYAIAERYTPRRPAPPDAVAEGFSPPSPTPTWDPFHYERRHSEETPLGNLTMGGTQQVAVVVPIEGPLARQETAMARVLRWASPSGRRQPKPDAAVVEITDESDLAALRRIAERLRKWPQASLALVGRGNVECLAAAIPELDAVLLSLADAARLAGSLEGTSLILNVQDRGAIEHALTAAQHARRDGVPVLLSAAPGSDAIRTYRSLAANAARRGVAVPIVLRAAAASGPEPYLGPAITMGSLLCDGIGDAVMVEGLEDSSALAFNILQAAGTRLTKTDYVACPSCGRTLFDLQETTERIKARTSHLVGVRLAIMGCIVNGPGEMADADFGYVGGAPGQVNLYVGKECVEKGVPAEEADDRLVELIKAHGKWQEE